MQEEQVGKSVQKPAIAVEEKPVKDREKLLHEERIYTTPVLMGMGSTPLLAIPETGRGEAVIKRAVVYYGETLERRIVTSGMLRIGRLPRENDLVLTDPAVSGDHAHLQVGEKGGMLVADHSTNGTHAELVKELDVDEKQVPSGGHVALLVGDRPIEVVLPGNLRFQIERRGRVVFLTEPKGKKIPLQTEVSDKATLTIGRSLENDLSYPPQFHMLSRRHARIMWRGGVLVVKDLKSSFGTSVRRVPPSPEAKQS